MLFQCNSCFTGVNLPELRFSKVFGMFVQKFSVSEINSNRKLNV